LGAHHGKGRERGSSMATGMKLIPCSHWNSAQVGHLSMEERRCFGFEWLAWCLFVLMRLKSKSTSRQTGLNGKRKMMFEHAFIH
jgi:hypothetical protein